MNFKSNEMNVSNLLNMGHCFTIPRFQREYSWDKKNYQEFYEDMMNNLTIVDNSIKHNQYFLGTMLFVGDFLGFKEKPIEVVDGQQRLTTITIMFSVLSDRFRELGENDLSDLLFNYIVKKNDDNELIRILQSNSSFPYFVYYIQDKEKKFNRTPSTEEEICIKETYDFFYKATAEDYLKKFLDKRYSTKASSIPHVNILKALRDQVLNSTFISITTESKEQANQIFAILNAKGKRLAYIDLIKNKIFEILKDGFDGIYAEDMWKKIKATLNTREESIGIATFFRHFWISKYKKCTASDIYDNFVKKIKKDENAYKLFLEDLLDNAQNYMKITNPNRDDYNNRKEYYWLVQSLKAINNTFNVVQTKIAILALYDVKNRKIIDAKMLKKSVLKIENFHFAYTAVCSKSSNNLENIYSKFAIELRKCKNKEEAKKVIDNFLIKRLDQLCPTYAEFSTNFKKLTYSKGGDKQMNIKTKYAINKLNLHYSEKGVFEEDGSIEHIIPESNGVFATNIGNLILLEEKINNDCDELIYENKLDYYEKSNYCWIKEFMKEHQNWTKNDIEKRAEFLADLYYKEIIKGK